MMQLVKIIQWSNDPQSPLLVYVSSQDDYEDHHRRILNRKMERGGEKVEQASRWQSIGGHVEQGKEWKKTRASHTLMTRRMYIQSDKFPRIGQHSFSCPEEQPTRATVYWLMNQSINAMCKQEVYGFWVCAWVHFLLHLSHCVRGKVHSVSSPSTGGFCRKAFLIWQESEGTLDCLCLLNNNFFHHFQTHFVEKNRLRFRFHCPCGI